MRQCLLNIVRTISKIIIFQIKIKNILEHGEISLPAFIGMLYVLFLWSKKEVNSYKNMPFVPNYRWGRVMFVNVSLYSLGDLWKTQHVSLTGRSVIIIPYFFFMCVQNQFLKGFINRSMEKVNSFDGGSDEPSFERLEGTHLREYYEIMQVQKKRVSQDEFRAFWGKKIMPLSFLAASRAIPFLLLAFS